MRTSVDIYLLLVGLFALIFGLPGVGFAGPVCEGGFIELSSDEPLPLRDARAECDRSIPSAPNVYGTTTCPCGGLTIQFNESEESPPGQCGTFDNPDKVIRQFHRSWYATDACGNENGTSQTVKLVDTTAPIISVPGNRDLMCTDGSSPDSTGHASATDNCAPDDLIRVTYEETGSLDECNSGTLTREWRARDSCNNVSSTVSQEIILRPKAPSLGLPHFESGLSCDVDDRSPSNTGGFASTHNNCPGPDPVLTYTTSKFNPDQCGTGQIYREWTAKSCGLETKRTQQIRITNNIAPSITAPANETIMCARFTNGLDSASANHRCEGVELDINVNNVVTEEICENQKTIIRHWTAGPVNATCDFPSVGAAQLIIVNDTEGPVLHSAAPADQAPQCASQVGDSVSLNFRDTCDGIINVQAEENTALGSCTNNFTSTRTWQATDACGNDSSLVSQTIAVDDTTPPSITGISDYDTMCNLSVHSDVAGIPTYSDNCGVVSETSHEDSGTLNQCGVGSLSRTHTATDDCGNTSSLEQALNVAAKPVVLNVPVNQNLLCNASTDPASTGNATAVPGCGGVVTISHSDSGADALDICGNGSFSRTWTATECDETANGVQTLSINDCADIELLKTTDGVVDPTQNWQFTLMNDDVNLNDATFGVANGLLFTDIGPLSASSPYMLCETGIPAGATANYQVDSDGDGIADLAVTPYNPDLPSNLGTLCLDVGDGTGYALPVGATDIACKLVIAVDNVLPKGDPRTPGYWKNWSTCTNGNQAQTAANNGGCAEGFCLLDDFIPTPGLALGMFNVPSCDAAVSILNHRALNNNKNMANDGLYKVARNLLAAKLNLAALASSCPAALDAIAAADELLKNEQYDGSGNYLKPRSAGLEDAIALAEILDSYNNGTLCANPLAAQTP